jgi:hypothetical protein
MPRLTTNGIKSNSIPSLPNWHSYKSMARFFVRYSGKCNRSIPRRTAIDATRPAYLNLLNP